MLLMSCGMTMPSTKPKNRITVAKASTLESTLRSLSFLILLKTRLWYMRARGLTR